MFREWGALGLRGAFLSEPFVRRKSPPVAFIILVIFLIAVVCLFWKEKQKKRRLYRVSKMRGEEVVADNWSQTE